MNDKERLEYFEDERKKLWQNVIDLRERLDEIIKNTTSELHREARGRLNKVSEYCNKITGRNSDTEILLKNILEKNKSQKLSFLN